MTAVARDVHWSLPEPARPGQSLHAGRITLDSGTLALTLGGGQIVTLVGPTDFELIDETEVFLHQGNASLRIVGNGDPCVIRVPHGAVVNLGTEFSVKVAADGTADVWVFDGKVLVSLTSAASTIREQPLAAGQSLRIGETLSPSPATAADFIRPLPGTGIPDSPPDPPTPPPRPPRARTPGGDSKMKAPAVESPAKPAANPSASTAPR